MHVFCFLKLQIACLETSDENAASVLKDESNDREPVMNECVFSRTESQSHSDCAHAVEMDAHAGSEDDRMLDSSLSDIFLGCDDPDSGSEARPHTHSPVYDLAALLADSQVQTAAEPYGWHFPTGLGLAETCYCPYVQFPDVSYYPAFRDSGGIEGGILGFILQSYTLFHPDRSLDALTE